MRSVIVAAAVTATLGVGAAYAGEGEETHPNTLFTEIPGVIAQPQFAPPSAYAAWGAYAPSTPYASTGPYTMGVPAYAAQSNSGTWLFPPNGNSGANS